MILLGIETATELVGVAVGDDDGPRAAAWASGRRQHAESLAPAIAHVLEQAGLTLGDVGAVAVDIGPGLFTGLRVGVATAKGLAQGLDAGLVECTSLEVLAAGVYAAGGTGPVVAVVDARRGEVFSARYLPDPGAPGGLRETSPPARFTPTALAAALIAEGLIAEGLASPGQAAGGQAAGGQPMGGPAGWSAVGDGARRYGDVLDGVPGLRVVGPAGPPPEVLVTLAAERLAAGGRTRPAAEVQPVYLREADARINWSRRDPAPHPAGRPGTGEA